MPGRKAASQQPGVDKGTPSHGEPFSPAVENYLLGLYDLQMDYGAPTPSRLAEHLRHFPEGEGLGTSLASVTGMLRRLQREGLVHMSGDKRITLTPRGTEVAEDVARRHHLAECMAVELLGVQLHRADQEAHRLEHFISPSLQERIRIVLGDPPICPYGRPIPSSPYQPPPTPIIPLSDAVPGVRYQVIQLPEDDEQLVQFLADHHIVPLRGLEVVEAAAYRDTMTLRTETGEVSIGYRVAAAIRVCAIDGAERPEP